MADLNKIISVNIDDNASSGLKKIDQNITKVTQSTKNMTQETKIPLVLRIKTITCPNCGLA